MQTAESEFYYYGAEVRSEFQKLKIMSHISQHRSFISVIRPGPLETRFGIMLPDVVSSVGGK